MSENMSDKNVKRYVRRNVNRNIKNMSDKTVKTYGRRNVKFSLAKQFYIFQILVPRRA